MKIVYCFCVIVNIILLSRNTDAGLVKSLFKSIHDGVQEIREDVRKVIHPKEDPKQETVTVGNVAANNSYGDIDKVITVTTTTAAYNNEAVNKEATGFVMPKDEDESKLVFVSIPTTAATVNFTSTTVKAGRENFAGGCSTGYMRTADGRCKPTF